MNSSMQASNAWRMLALLFVANLLNVYDRVIGLNPDISEL